MNNRYYGMRHGNSVPQQRGIVLSNLEVAVRMEYGLVFHGCREVIQSATKARREGLLDEHTIIISSPLSRGRQSAELVGDVLGVRRIVVNDCLAERGFGKWEGADNSSYLIVWESDARDSSHTEHGVESANAVQIRTMSLLDELEGRFSGETILLVSHGDVLQIMQTGIKGMSASEHRSLPSFETGEIRLLG